jgi:hypothetical protein
MTTREVVQIVGRYLEDDGATLERRYGPEAAIAAHDLAALLKARLQGESAYVSLWDQLEAEPRQTVEELAGALEALAEADPALSRRMRAFLEEYQRVTTRTASEEELSEEEAFEEGDMDTAQQGSNAYQFLDSPGDYNEAGTYLYGNLRPGVASTNDLDVEEEEVLVENGLEALAPDVSQIVALFQELYAFVEGYEGPSPAIKQSLRVELEQMADDVAEGRDEYEEFITSHLCAIERLSPEIYRLVVEKLASPEADFAPVVQQVARRMLDAN